MRDDDGQQAVLIKFLIAAVARQIRALRDSGYAIENTVGDLISRGGSDLSSAYQTLQRLDHLVQSLDGISDYLDNLIEEIDPSLSVDPSTAIRLIKQRDLAIALVGADMSLNEENAENGTGEACFF